MKSILERLYPSSNQNILSKESEKIIFEEITQFIVKYGSSITIEALNIETENRTDLNRGRGCSKSEKSMNSFE